MQYPLEVHLLKSHVLLLLPGIEFYSVCIDHGEMSQSLADRSSQQGGSYSSMENICLHSNLGDPELETWLGSQGGGG